MAAAIRLHVPCELVWTQFPHAGAISTDRIMRGDGRKVGVTVAQAIVLVRDKLNDRERATFQMFIDGGYYDADEWEELLAALRADAGHSDCG